ncbi:hypothetical protein PR048_011171 [Dryococelus australis]|uniref:DUF4371 domain-containing protein n=1 Tax=Dryococelus australis TaxID=614101 RepID=A0ABQ9HL16_9NEOP|nr:hypothetical protein PR048_011171 [Dryococelus australis]
MEKAQKALITIFSSIKFLATHGLTLRNKQEKEGNLYELLELRGNEIPDVKDWLYKQHNWLSHDIQNEKLQLLSLTVVRKLNKDIKNIKYFAINVDETIDNSTEEQVFISLRHVNDDFDVFEYFIGLYEISSTMGNNLAAIIEDVLLRLDISIKDCRADDDSALAKNATLKPLCPTRWTVRSKSLDIVNSQYETIPSVFDSLKSKESAANGLSAFLEKASKKLARNLQTSDIIITPALRQTEIVMGRLTDLRTKEKFTELLE